MKKRIIAGIIGFSLLTVNSMVAFAAIDPHQTPDRAFNFTLKAYQGNSYTQNYNKETNNQFSYIKVNGLTDTNLVTLWIAAGSGSGYVGVSEDITRAISQDFSVAYYTKGTRYDGDLVTLGAENKQNVSYTAGVSGLVDFD